MAKAPAFQFYANDFMDATRFWDANAVGLYVRCMCIQWTHGYIPADLTALARGLGCTVEELQKCWEVIGPKFVPCEQGLQNQRLEAVRAHREGVSNERSKAAKSRWNSNANASAKPVQRKLKKKLKIEEEREEVREVELNWPRWAGERVKATWEEFKEYRWTTHRMKYKSRKTEQLAVNLLAAYYATGPECVDGLNLSMAKGWKFPVDPTAQRTNGTAKPAELTKAEANTELERIRAEHGIAPGGFIETHLIPKEVLEAIRRP